MASALLMRKRKEKGKWCSRCGGLPVEVIYFQGKELKHQRYMTVCWDCLQYLKGAARKVYRKRGKI